MKRILMSVTHATGKLDANVDYIINNGVVSILKISSPITGWELTQYSGMSDKELKRIYLICCANASYELDISFCPFESGSKEHELYIDEILRLATEEAKNG